MSARLQTVLVVEDDAADRWLLVDHLRHLGVANVVEAGSGLMALMILSGGLSPDLVVCDLFMPGMDGAELLRRFGERGESFNLILTSGHDVAMLQSAQAMAEGYGLVVSGTLHKPYDRRALEARLSAAPVAAARPSRPLSGRELSVIDDGLIDQALDEGWMGAHFQPQVELSSGAIIGAEALLRWIGPNRPDVSTGVLVQALEAGGHMGRVTEDMLRQASEEVQRWERRGRSMSIAVNISATLLDNVGVADRWLGIVQDAGASPERITFELTEDALATDRLRALDVLTRLRLRGFGLAMDDFGSGYSTLSLLSDLPITELKIDRSLVHGAVGDWRRRAMIDTIQQLSSKLGLRTVAEGVENAHDLHVLRQAGCDVAQGWLFAPAMDWMDFADLVADRSDLIDLAGAPVGDAATG